MAPTLGPDDELGVSDLMHVIEAHALHDCEIREQTSLLAQLGQEGMVDGHCTHRLKRELMERSTAVEWLAPRKESNNFSMIGGDEPVAATAIMVELTILCSSREPAWSRLCDVFDTDDKSELR